MKQPKLNDLLQSLVKVCIKSHKGLLLGLWHPGVKGGGREARAWTPLRKRKTTLGSWGGKRSKEWEDGSLETEAGIGLTVFSCSVVSDSLRSHGLQPARLLCPWDSPGKNTEVACHALLQGVFPTQGLNPGLLHCRLILYRLSHEASKLGTYFKCRVVTRKIWDDNYSDYFCCCL